MFPLSLLAPLSIEIMIDRGWLSAVQAHSITCSCSAAMEIMCACSLVGSHGGQKHGNTFNLHTGLTIPM